MSPGISNDQIVALYESSEGTVTIDEIYEALGGDVNKAAIKIALVNGSALYRKKAEENGDEIFSKDDDELAKQVMRNLLVSADNDVVRYRVAARIMDERRGRNDNKTAKNLNFNVTLISQQIMEAEKAIERAKTAVVDVDPRHKHLKEITI